MGWGEGRGIGKRKEKRGLGLISKKKIKEIVNYFTYDVVNNPVEDNEC